MDIKAQCKCGAVLKANAGLAGKQAKCPKCGEAVVIPKPDSIRVTCSCGQEIKAKASFAGKRVNCPTCKQPLDIPNTAELPLREVPGPTKLSQSRPLGNAPIPSPDAPGILFNNSVWDDVAKSVASAETAAKVEHKTMEGSNQYAANSRRVSFDHVQRGITFVYIGQWLIIAIVLYTQVGMLFFRTAPLGALPPLILYGVSSLLSMIGRILCLTVPKKVGATELIYVAVGFDVIALFTTVSGLIPGIPDVSGFAAFLTDFATLAFIFFLRKLATYVKSDDLIQRASEALFYQAGLAVFAVILFVVVISQASSEATFSFWVIVIPLGCLGFLIRLMAFLRYFQVVSGLRLSLH